MASIQNYIECQVALPANVQTGTKLMIQVDNSGRKFQIVVPPGARGGQTIRVRVPKGPPTPPVVQGRTVTSSTTPPRPQQRQQQQQQQHPLWHGWFYKQQPHFPHGWQKRYGSISPRARSDGSYEFIYYSNDADMRSGTRRGTLPLDWSETPSSFKGRICLDGPPTREGKQQFILQTAHRDYNLAFGGPSTDPAAFYLCYRATVCGDDRDISKQAICGGNENDTNMATFRLQSLYTEQSRIEALGMDRFEAAATLVGCGGDGDAALRILLAADARKRGVSFTPPNNLNLAAAAAAAGPSGEAEANARRDLEAMGFTNSDAIAAVKSQGTDTDLCMMWLLQKRETPKLKGERYELSFDTGPLGIKVTSGNEYTCDFPVVKPSEGGSKHIATWENQHLPMPGHVCEAYSVQGGNWVTLSGTIDERYDECISAATGPRPISFRLVAQDGVGVLKEPPVSNTPPPSYAAAATCWEYEKNGAWYAYPDDVQHRLNTAVSTGASCVQGIALDGGVYNLFVDSMTQFNNTTNEFSAIRSPSSSSKQVPSENELSLQQNWERQQKQHQGNLPISQGYQAPLLDLLDAPDAPPVLMAQSSDESSDDQGLALFATMLTNDDDADVYAAQRAECSVCFEDLCAEPVGLFFDPSGGRVCRHFFHYQCACDLPQKCCPLCNREFESVKELPDPLESPKQWFMMVDVTNNGTLDKKGVVEALKAQLPLNEDKLEKHFDDLWKRWDTDGSGDLSLSELINPKNGLLEYLKHLKNERNSEALLSTTGGGGGGGVASETDLIDFISSVSIKESNSSIEAPSLSMSSREVWFHHFDSSKTGNLNISELTTAINSSGGQVEQDMVAMLLMACDLKTEGQVLEEEFMKSGGVGELLIASLGLGNDT